MMLKTFMETERGPIARVTFSLPNSIWADTIHLVGDFNDWNHSSHPFQHGREEGWTLTVDWKWADVTSFAIGSMESGSMTVTPMGTCVIVSAVITSLWLQIRNLSTILTASSTTPLT